MCIKISEFIGLLTRGNTASQRSLGRFYIVTLYLRLLGQTVSDPMQMHSCTCINNFQHKITLNCCLCIGIDILLHKSINVSVFENYLIEKNIYKRAICLFKTYI